MSKKESVPAENIEEKDPSMTPEQEFPVNENQQIEKYEGEIVEIMPMDVDAMADTYHKMAQFVKKVMRTEVDFGIVPGTKKPSLYKPGAEKLQRFFGYSAPNKLSHSVEQWEVPATATTFPLFHYRYTTTVYNKSGQLLASCDGECNSYESKYHWRWVTADKATEDEKAHCETMAGTEREPAFAIKNKQTTGQYGKPMEYWESWEKDIASGVATKVDIKKRDNTTMPGYERGGLMYRVPNNDIHSQVNTIMKMAQKRSYVGAIIIAANASEYFTQDMEDTSKVEEQPTIKMLVPAKDAMAIKLMEYVKTLGIAEPGFWIKDLLEKNNIVWSLDSWETIVNLIDQEAAASK